MHQSFCTFNNAIIWLIDRDDIKHHVCHSIWICHFFSALKSFIENEITVWTKQLEEIEEKFLSCEELDSQVCSPPRKRKKKGPTKTSDSRNENAMAKLAATLQIDNIKKVRDICPQHLKNFNFHISASLRKPLYHMVVINIQKPYNLIH